MAETLTAPDAAKKLGVSVTTLKNWAERVGIGQKTGSGVWLYTDKDLHILEIVQVLRNEERGFETITRRLREEMPDLDLPPDGDTETAPPVDESRHQLVTTDDIRNIVSEVIRSENDLAERYARATYRIGELEATVKNLETRDRESRLLLTEGSQEATKVRSEVDELRQKLAISEAEKRQLQELMERPWWKRFLGK